MIQIKIAKWIDIIDPKLGRGGLVNAEHFIGFLHKEIRQSTFEELRIPLQVVSTDYWTGEQVVFDSGELLPAIRASMALPGVFAPVEYGGRILVDGGIVNPLPFDLIMGTCSVTIAIDVTGTMLKRVREKPSFFDSIFRTVRIMGQAITQEKLKWQQPDTLAVQTLRNWSTSANFLATIAILIATGVLHFLTTIPQQPALLHNLNFLGSTSPTMITAKLFAIVATLLAAFFNFAVAIRYYNHVAIEINVPQPRQGEGDIAIVQRLMDRAGTHYTVGMRCFYLAMPLALWLFGALWLLLGSMVLCVALYMMDHLK